MFQDLTPRATNLYDVLLALVTLVIVPLVTSWITQKRIAPKIEASRKESSNQIEEVRQEAAAAKVAAVDAVRETVAGNQHLEEVQKAVNGDKEKLTLQVQMLQAENHNLRAEVAGRRKSDG